MSTGHNKWVLYLSINEAMKINWENLKWCISACDIIPMATDEIYSIPVCVCVCVFFFFKISQNYKGLMCQKDACANLFECTFIFKYDTESSNDID